jgi:hypothetical protein
VAKFNVWDAATSSSLIPTALHPYPQDRHAFPLGTVASPTIKDEQHQIFRPLSEREQLRSTHLTAVMPSVCAFAVAALTKPPNVTPMARK